MRSFNQLQKRWDDHVSRGCYHPGPCDQGCWACAWRGHDFGAHGRDAFRREGSCGRSRSGAASESARCFLLGPSSARHRQEYRKSFGTMGARRKGFSAYPFGFHGLPRLESANDVYRLYLAEALLDDGLPPREMLAELGLFRAMRQLDKFDPDQPRVPAGSGRESGQWTKDGSLASTSAGEDHKVQLAGDVIHVGTLVGISISGAPGEIPRTTCIYQSALGDFE